MTPPHHIVLYAIVYSKMFALGAYEEAGGAACKSCVAIFEACKSASLSCAACGTTGPAFWLTGAACCCKDGAAGGTAAPCFTVCEDVSAI